MEAIANRREYIEGQLAGGRSIVGLSYAGGVLLLTVGRESQKLFEIYDRIALGAIGHPGDIERLRMAAIEIASTEGFTRSAADVSLRRLATYSISPALKTAFEQVYGAPYLARLLFAELGRSEEDDLFVRMDYDGTILTNGGGFAQDRKPFGVASGRAAAEQMMERFLESQPGESRNLDETIRVALNTWAVGSLVWEDTEEAELPGATAIAARLKEELSRATIEAVVLERESRGYVTYRALHHDELSSFQFQH